MEMATGMVRVIRVAPGYRAPVSRTSRKPGAPGGGAHPKGQAYSPEYHEGW